MTDIAHFYGSDLTISAIGDTATVSGDNAVQQRLLRRLMTNPGDYVQHPDYGAGLGVLVGLPTNVGQIGGLIKRQMKKEAGIAQTPPPTVSVFADGGGGVAITIGYTDAQTGAPATFTFPLGS